MTFFSQKQAFFLQKTVLAASSLIRKLPENTAAYLATALGLAAEKAWLSERRRIYENIDRVYYRAAIQPPMPIDIIIKKSYIHFAMLLVELLRYPSVTPAYFNDKFSFKGENHLKDALKKNKGVILTLPHIGNWEYLGAAIVNRGYKLNSFYLAQKEGSLGPSLDYFREFSGIKLHDRDKGGMGALKALKRNQILGMIADQDGNKNGVYMDFLGHWVSMPAGPANWSIKTGAAALPLYSLRKGFTFKYDACFFKPFDDEKEDNLNEMIVSRTLKVGSWMEKMILEYPHQYLWFYDRFRPRHEGWTTSEINSKGQMYHGTGRYSG